MKKPTFEFNITGIVQGVGFRPFLFNLAREFELKGYILNNGNAGVRAVLQGDLENIENFTITLKKRKPPISFIDSIDLKDLTEISHAINSFRNIKIKQSEQGRGISLTLPPDIAVCDDCLDDMYNPNLHKYYMYPFIACAACGPRFTTVKELPYDRKYTTMIDFPFCQQAKPESCLQEYSDFQNKRFHAQTFACSNCGPNYKLYDKDGRELKIPSIKGIIKGTANRINSGNIVAVKGIGGTHLVCLADEDEVILKLRKRKGMRKYKPFALMIPNVKVIEANFLISKREMELLKSFRRPIILLEKKPHFKRKFISEHVAPGLNNIGIILPYTGIHHLLFNHVGQKPLVYTSGNKSSIPMGIDNEKIFEQLSGLADFYLLHDRPIYQRADDSVLRVHGDKVKLIRRSRGYVPEYLPLPFEVDVPGALATGPELVGTAAVLRYNRIFPTQHIGHVVNLETHDFLKDSLFHMKKLLQIREDEIKFIACDAHPFFITTRFGKELSEQFNVPLYTIQHHFAHGLALMAENKVGSEEEIICICTDGVGYGEDGNVWGGEILLTSYNGYERLGHLKYQPMIGGDRCTKYPARMAASMILHSLEIEEALIIFEKLEIKNDLEHGITELNTLISQYKSANNLFPSGNIPLTSSTGRVFDAVSYLLGASTIKTYRGEPAMRLEGLASRGNAENVSLDIEYSKDKGIFIINTSKLILDIISLLENNSIKREDIATTFQKELARAFANVAIILAEELGIKKIGLTGGVAYNYNFSNTIKQSIVQKGLQFLEHDLIPPGDAGISTGQLIGGIFQFLK